VVDLSNVDNLQGVLDSTDRALKDVVHDAGCPVVATRIRFVGASPVHSELQGKSLWLRQKVLTLGAERHGDCLWIEKVVLATTSKLDREELLSGDGALGGLARSILEIPDDPTTVRGLDAALSALMEKLPAEVSLADDGLRLEDPEFVARLIREARDLLIGKLLEAGGES
jgi:hypothetical protein